MLTRPLPYEAEAEAETKEEAEAETKEAEAETKEAEAKTRFFGLRPETEFREFRKFKEVIMQAFANLI